MFKSNLNNINHKANKLHKSILNKAIKGMAIGAISLGMLGGASIINNVVSKPVAHAYSFEAKSDIPAAKNADNEAIAYNNSVDPNVAKDAEKYGPSDADDWENDDPETFAKYAPQIASHWTKNQKKEFYNLTGVNIDDITPSHPIKEVSDSDLNVDPNYIPKPKKHNHQRKPKITKPNKHKNKARHHNTNRNKRTRKPRRKVAKHFNKKHAKRATRKHATHKAKNYNYLGTYKQGERQARKDLHNGNYPSFKQLIKNKKLLNNKYIDGYDNIFVKGVHKDDDGSEMFGVDLSVAHTYLASRNKITKKAYYDFYGNRKPNHYLMKHNKHYKKVYNSLDIL